MGIKSTIWQVWLFITLLLSLSTAATAGSRLEPTISAEKLALTSPDKRNVLGIGVANGKPYFTLAKDNQPLLLKSPLGLQLESGPFKPFAVESFRVSQVDDTWQQPWGTKTSVRDHYNAAKLVLLENSGQHPRRLVIEFRAYNDGIALRYSLPAQDHFETSPIVAEQTTFSFAENRMASGYVKERLPTTPQPISDIETLSIPVVISGNDNLRLAIHEAGLLHSAPVEIEGNSAVTNGLRLNASPSSYKLPFSTSWRVLMIGDEPGELLMSDLLTNLSPPSQIADTSWIVPGKSLWDWRVRGGKYGDFEYKIDEPSLRRFIDFAAENGVRYVMIDANWYGPEHHATSNPFTPAENIPVPALIKYGLEKNVGFILYMNDRADKHYDLDELFRTYKEWGAAGIKYGFLKSKGQVKVKKTLRIVELAAKHKLLINFHDNPIPPTGLRRTYPNWLTREFIHGQTDGGRTFKPSGYLQMMHLNGITGPLDMSNGFYRLTDLDDHRTYVRQPVLSTVAAENARVLITYSGLVIVPDAPEEYLKKADIFEFIREMPTTWDETLVLKSDPQRELSIARRSGDAWFVGTVYDEAGGDLEMTLDFLEPGVTYQATLYEDAADAHYETNREAYAIRHKEVRRGDRINAKIAPGGGNSIWLRKKTQ